MSNYSSYQTGVEQNATTTDFSPEAPQQGQGISIKSAEGVSSVGPGGQSSTRTVETVSTTDLSSYGANDWRSTAQDGRMGMSTNQIDADTTVEIGGMRAEVSTFVEAGILRETESGYELAPQEQQQEQPQAAEAGSMDAQEIAELNSAMDGFDSSTLQKGSAMSIAAVVGDGSLDGVVSAVAQDTGMEPAEVAVKVQAVADKFQAQADRHITQHLGIPASDLPGFYEFCKQPQNRANLQAAIQNQVYGNSMRGYKGLADAYMAGVAPNTDTLQAHGLETMTGHNGEEMVRIKGTWVATKVAAAAGLI